MSNPNKLQSLEILPFKLTRVSHYDPNNLLVKDVKKERKKEKKCDGYDILCFDSLTHTKND
jgi:hypothetical protein